MTSGCQARWFTGSHQVCTRVILNEGTQCQFKHRAWCPKKQGSNSSQRQDVSNKALDLALCLKKHYGPSSLRRTITSKKEERLWGKWKEKRKSMEQKASITLLFGLRTLLQQASL
jgi:hypothetical protein